jgi:hypothetical protein
MSCQYGKLKDILKSPVEVVNEPLGFLWLKRKGLERIAW